MRDAPREMFTRLRAGFFRHHTHFVAEMKRKRLSGRPGLRAATGTLRRGLVVQRQGSTLTDLEVRSVFTGAHAFFAHVHETGMTIRPKNADALVFPIRKGAAPSSVAVTKAHISRSSQIASWVRTDHVVIPPRLEFKTTWDRMRKALAKEVNAAAGEALRGQRA